MLWSSKLLMIQITFSVILGLRWKMQLLFKIDNCGAPGPDRIKINLSKHTQKLAPIHTSAVPIVFKCQQKRTIIAGGSQHEVAEPFKKIHNFIDFFQQIRAYLGSISWYWYVYCPGPESLQHRLHSGWWWVVGEVVVILDRIMGASGKIKSDQIWFSTIHTSHLRSG